MGKKKKKVLIFSLVSVFLFIHCCPFLFVGVFLRGMTNLYFLLSVFRYCHCEKSQSYQQLNLFLKPLT